MAGIDYENFEEALRSNFKAVRLASGKSQTEFAKISNVKQSTIAKFENGYSPNVTLRTVFELAKLCSMPLSDLVLASEGDKEKFSKDDSWPALNREIEKLPNLKRKWLANIVKEMIRTEKLS